MSAQKSAAHSDPADRWRFRRDLVICLAHRNGASLRLLADVFDLEASRVHAIVKAFRKEYGGGLPTLFESEQGPRLRVVIELPASPRKIDPQLVGPTAPEPAPSARSRTGRGGPRNPPRTGRPPLTDAAGAA